MSKEAKIIIFAIITMAMNILAPILMINLYKGYTAESFIVGSPDKSVVITEYVEPKDYLYQENLSSLTFVQEDEYWVASYNFEDREFDIEKTYAIFVNDYICTPVDVLGSKVSGTHTIKFNDINNDTLDITKMSIDFEFYTTYSSILLKVETADITYFNGFKQNPGFILTLTEIDPNLLEIVKNTTITITPEEPDENVVAVTFKSYDDSVLNTYYVEVGNTLSTTPDEPTRAGYVFQGWTLDGANIVDDLSTLTFSENTTFTAVFEEVVVAGPTALAITWEVVFDTGSSPVIDGYNIWTDGTDTYLSDEYAQFVLDKETFTWNQKIWNGFYYDIYGEHIWTDGVNIYCSYYEYIYESSTGATSTYVGQFVLNKETSTWNAKSWNGLMKFFGNQIWTDGSNIYYSNGTEQYVLNVNTSTWNTKSWNGLMKFFGNQIWTDGTDIYYSNGTDQYVLDKETSTWMIKEWNCNIYGEYIWTDGTDIYHSNADTHYVLIDSNAGYWAEIDFIDLQDYGCGRNIWTDGTNYYYSYHSEQYVILSPYKDYPVTVYIGSLTLVSCSNDYTVDDDVNIVCRAGSSIIVTWDDPMFIVASYTGQNCTIEEYDDGDDTTDAYIIYVGGLGSYAQVDLSVTSPSLKKDEFDNMTGLV